MPPEPEKAIELAEREHVIPLAHERQAIKPEVESGFAAKNMLRSDPYLGTLVARELKARL